MNFDTIVTGDLYTIKKTLAAISTDILAEGDFHERLAPAVKQYSELMFGLTGITENQSEHLQDIITSHGRAIAAVKAGFCIKEPIRVQRFCRGLYKAVVDRLKQEPNRPVHVVYAGTGPFAALALPVMMQFKSSQLQFTLLEINEVSYNALRKVLKDLELDTYVKRFELCDAITWRVPDERIDIVISETMNYALMKEPQINIMLNMVSQLGDKVIYIPQDIGVQLTIDNGRDSLTRVADLYNFNIEAYQKIIAQSVNHNGWLFDATAVDYQPEAKGRPVYTTSIIVYNEDKLTGHDCSLNLHQPVRPALPDEACTLLFTYQDGERPGFVYQTADK
ncbi:hypothetical protein BEL04_07810 [Mucilaginibacter sp. PPCGB 2223]|uniref:hypothetical protein n=1 Tax=Mucilaginibacter sp. PPCGB 2223 TaxID=1886027 RepID=UPI000824FFA7|nr:hypothetical protein [Mucilaginibacter sp. PPCGB 2223]OCX54163.1 hypothetical protein BEL04_07810 [Mucilaginibacter sp. PPCGB 2223]